MIFFEGNSTTLTLQPHEVSEGVGGWRNDTYQLEVWRTFLHPADLFQVLTKGVIHYAAYLAAVLTGKESYLPQAVRDRYPHFSGVLAIKTFIIYLFPLLLQLVFTRLRRNERSA